jgi:hypothetical protein
MEKNNSLKSKRGQIVYSEKELLLGLKMMERLEKITDMMLFLLKHRNLYFSYILMSTDDRSLKTTLRQEKRDTDLLLPIDVDMNLYVIICQETKIEGGYRFSERLIRKLEVEEKSEHRHHCVVLTVTSLTHSFREIVFHLLDIYISQENDKRRQAQITLRTI